MQRRRLQQQGKYQSQRLFTASEVAEFEYCPLVWWHEQFEPLVEADSEELFAELVGLEHEHGPQATALPEYQVIEQLLVRRGAFEEGRQQHAEHAEEVAEVEEGRMSVPSASGAARVLLWAMLIILALGLLLIVGSFVLSRIH